MRWHQPVNKTNWWARPQHSVGTPSARLANPASCALLRASSPGRSLRSEVHVRVGGVWKHIPPPVPVKKRITARRCAERMFTLTDLVWLAGLIASKQTPTLQSLQHPSTQHPPSPPQNSWNRPIPFRAKRFTSGERDEAHLRTDWLKYSF